MVWELGPNRCPLYVGAFKMHIDRRPVRAVKVLNHPQTRRTKLFDILFTTNSGRTSCTCKDMDVYLKGDV